MRIVAIILMVAVAGFSAQAQAKQKRAIMSAPPVETEQAYVAPVCPRLCNTDVSPCDPPEFKRADGRCNMGNYSGGFN